MTQNSIIICKEEVQPRNIVGDKHVQHIQWLPKVMQHSLQTYKIDIFLEVGKAHDKWCQYGLNKVCS